MDKCNRVIFFVRCHGEPDEQIEEEMMSEFANTAEAYREHGWGILTIGRQYYHDKADCRGHPDPEDECDE